ncbi:DJ-1/PfpI family protein [Pantoea allii]|uniref:DJ-1/PfpI family protein n=1 Tax=Pantoea allii TaxID=574096 RepID=A0ABS6VDQ6_9GAMM|nr:MULTISPECIES: DJ-1/PfpI family protein [Pantoea]MBW1213834.1 DJ-1/PfpI family protein [Pantoea allii]MBW1256923.1 DJ-1/PfpI family protein [Pantoea allii]MBW1266000.1 DJ-1/PfpI family protein [Pantoea allii]MBW1288621.1 DJ-1/PfpI family protein [Pantoea allii]OAE08133.1 thiamine biosynthesis protein ThiJ [Pantoea sp. OXWO6B1]
MSDSVCTSIGLLLFPALTQLDLTGPYEVFARAPNTQVHLIWKNLDLVVSDRGMAIQPTTTFKTCPQLDVICVPGGPGQINLMDDDDVLSFIRSQSEQARLVTSVCTGSLVLGAAGLLNGYKATSHWASLDQLALLGAEPVNERVVRDRNRITGAGVTSGIDFALNVVSEIHGSNIAQTIQLHLEYDPEPPFACGSPRTASKEQLKNAQEQAAPFIEKRRQATLKAAARLFR